MKTEYIIQEIKERATCAIIGDVNEIEAYIDLHRIKSCIEQEMETLKEYALITLENRYDGKYEENGITVDRTQSGRYNYSSIPQWKALTDQIKEIEKRAQEAYKMSLKGAIAVTAYGEMIEVAEYIPSKASLRISFK